MAAPELIVDNDEPICFPEPETWNSEDGGVVIVRFRCDRCGEMGKGFQGPASFFPEVIALAKEEFLRELACDAAKSSAAARHALKAEQAWDAAAAEGDGDGDATVEDGRNRDRSGAPETVPRWEMSFEHNPGYALQRIARGLPPSVLIYGLYCALGDDDRAFGREWAETFGPGWGMMSDLEKPRLQKAAGMLITALGGIIRSDAELLEKKLGICVDPLNLRLKALVDDVIAGLHAAMSCNRDEVPVGATPADTMAMLAAARIDTGSLETVPMYKLLYRLRVQFSRHPIADMLSDMSEEEPLSEDQLDRLAFVAAVGAGWSTFVGPLQTRIAVELGRRSKIGTGAR